MSRLTRSIATSSVALIVVVSGCGRSQVTSQPDRQTIERYADDDVEVYGPYAVVKLPITDGVPVWNPTQIELGPDGAMYVANHTGEIYSLRDTDGDGLEDSAVLFCDVTEDGLRSPASLAFKGNDLYVGTAQQIRIYTDTDGDGRADSSRVFFDDVPFSEHPYEWTSALTFADDGSLYFILTSDSWNAGASPDPLGLRGSIVHLSPDGTEMERYATGVRSVHGMVMTPQGQLLFSDNEGGGNPVEELNLAVQGDFYGHNPEKYGSPDVAGPVHAFETEVAPAGMALNSIENDFGGTAGDLFVAFYGPGERWQRGAIGRVRITNQGESIELTEYPVATGLAKVSDVGFGQSGDLYATQVGVTDYWYQHVGETDGAIYRLIEAPWVSPLPFDAATPKRALASSDQVERGKQLFADLACSACHSVDGRTELLGPNLKDITRVYSDAELVEEIQEPSKRIKPSMIATRVTKTNGDVLLGRVVQSNQNEIALIGIGNIITRISRQEIRETEDVAESMMYPGLLNGISEEQKADLLAYLSSLGQTND